MYIPVQKIDKPSPWKSWNIFFRVMTTLCFNSVENDPYSNMGCSPEEKRIQQLRTQVRTQGPVLKTKLYHNLQSLA
jgi:hypothetical protein